MIYHWKSDAQKLGLTLSEPWRLIYSAKHSNNRQLQMDKYPCLIKEKVRPNLLLSISLTVLGSTSKVSNLYFLLLSAPESCNALLR